MTYASPAVFRPTAGLGVAAQVLIGVSTVAHALATVGEWHEDWPLAALQGLDYLALFLAAGFFMAWLWRAWGNAALIVAPRPMKWARGWTVGSWFVPIADFWLPAPVVLNVCDASSGWRVSSRKFVTLWWLLFLLAEIAGRVRWWTYSYQMIGSQVVSRDAHLFSLHSEPAAWVVMTLVEIGAAAMGILLVKRVTDFQSAAVRSAAWPSTTT